MSIVRNITATALLAAALATGANAGQIFSFQDPVGVASFTNYMFETTDLLPGGPNPVATIENKYTGNVTFDVSTFNSSGIFQGTNSYAAKYFISNGSNPLTNDLFNGSTTSGSYAAGSGAITFVNPTTNNILLKIDFSGSSLSYGNFAAGGTIGFSGSLLTTGETGNENASFGFPNRYVPTGQAANYFLGHHTGSFTSSIGNIAPVPEPASMAALAMGGLALLRRKRRN